MKKNYYILILVLLYLFFLLIKNTSLYSQNLSKNILILNSYHQNLSWTHRITEQIVKSFNNYSVFIENMDSKRFSRNKIFKIYAYYLKEKYKNIKIDLIFVSDNNALDFIVNLKKTFFKNVPVVFCGINNFSYKMLKNFNDITGVVEDVDIEGTIKAILALHPNIKNIYALMGAAYTSQIYYNRIFHLREKYEKIVNINIINGKFYSKSALKNRLHNLNNNSVILLLNLFLLADGTKFGIKNSIDFIYKYSKKPIYTCWDVYLNFKGVVGGKITSSRLQGLTAAGFGNQILFNNISPEILPVLRKSPSEYIFDYKNLKLFNIDLKDFPFSYRLIHAPPKLMKTLKAKQQYIDILQFLLIILILTISWSFFNIYQRKKLEQTLEEKNTQLLTLINGTDDIVFLKDNLGRWLLTNNSAVKLFNFKNINYQYKTDVELANEQPFFKDALLAFLKTDKIAWENKKATRSKEIIPQKNGEPKIYDIIKTPIFNEKGEKKLLIVIGRDITELKKMEENLLQAQKLEVVGKVAGGIAHDFNNILTSILANVELCLLKLEKDSSLKKYIDTIKYSCEKAAILVNKLLIFSKKNYKLPEIIELNNLIKNMENILKSLIPEDISLIFKLSKDKLYIKAEPIQIEQALTNLILNSKDALTEKKSSDKKIILSTEKIFLKEKDILNSENLSFNNNYALITIYDNGIGIDDEIKHQVFEPFFTTKPESKGTGLGLTTVFEIIKNINGFIEFESKKNKYTKFKIFIPLTNTKDFSPENKNSSKVMKITKKINKTILFVEDNEEILNTIGQFLKQIAENLIIANNGVSAIELIKKQNKKIDILITDIVMPKIDGIELANILMKSFPELKIILTSGYDKGKIKNGSLNFKYFYLQKPYTIQNLVKIIES